MTQKTKLEILGPYTPDHPGLFCTRDLSPARIICTDIKGEDSIAAIIGTEGREFVLTFKTNGKHLSGAKSPYDLMNAREVPVAREFWDAVGRVSGSVHFRFHSEEESMDFWRKCADQVEIIHVREVLPENDQ